jgi:ankyrin repeat protein
MVMPVYVAARDSRAEVLQTNGNPAGSEAAELWEMLQLTIERGCTRVARPEDAQFLLYTAAISGHADMLQLLVASGANVNTATTDDGTTPVCIAA